MFSVERPRALTFARRPRFQRQRVNIGLHEVAERGVDALVAPDQGHAREVCRDDSHAKVPAAVASALVPGVAMTFIVDVELRGSQLAFKDCADALDARTHGSVLRNGRTQTSR